MFERALTQAQISRCLFNAGSEKRLTHGIDSHFSFFDSEAFTIIVEKETGKEIKSQKLFYQAWF